jgi:cytochrome c oxidase cbb3-type subunit 3
MQGGSTTAAQPARVPPASETAAIPLGAPPGQPVSIASQIQNPFEGNASAVQEGKTLFGSMNCVYCHGAQASGLMGPSLQDGGWRYGGTPAEIFNSIHDGRPKGMPAFGERLPPAEIWKIVAYIETLGGAEPPATPGMKALGPTPPTPSPEPAGELDTKSKHPTPGDQGARNDAQGAKAADQPT